MRRRELGDLQWRDVHLDAPRTHLRLRAEATKSKRADELPLPSHLVRELRAVRPPFCTPTAPVFTTVPKFDTWKADLKRAGVTYRDEATNEIVGFHSLRVTFISELERAGVSPRTIMELARHTDYRLTAGTYTDRRVLDTFGAAAKLPDYVDNSGNSRETARRTGTDDVPVSSDRSMDQIRHQMECATGQSGSSTGASLRSAHGGIQGKTPQNAGLGGTPRVGLEPTT